MDLQLCPNGQNSLLHDAQSHLAWLDITRFEATPVVGHTQFYALPFSLFPPSFPPTGGDERGGEAAQTHRHVTGAGVLGHIVQRLLGNAVQGNVNVFRERALTLHCHRDGHARPSRDGFTKLSQQVVQARFGQSRRSQLQQQGTHLGHGPPAQLPQFLQELSPLILIAFPESGQCLGDEAGRKQRLGDGVVQLAGQPTALFHHGQLLGLLVEASVLNGDSRLVRQGLKHHQVALVEGIQAIALHIKHADDLSLGLDGHSELRTALAASHPDVARLLAHILYQKGLARSSDPARDTLLAHFEP